MTTIGNYAFKGCSGLTSVTIPNSVTRIGFYVFGGCHSLPSENGIRYVGPYLVEAADKTLSKYTIKEGTKWISPYAFQNCSSPTEIVIPNSVTTIESCAFKGCSSLTSVVIPNSVTTIWDNAFSGCSSLTSVVIPNSVTGVSFGAFSGCSGLTSVVIPNSVTTIEFGVFSGCSSLTSVVIPNSVTTIESYSFENCTGLKSVEIPNPVTEIGNWAFEYCSNLTEIYSLNTTPPTVYFNTFKEVSKSDCVVKVPAEAVEAYKAAEYWKDFFNIVALTDEELQALPVESVQVDARLGKGKAYGLDGREARKGQRGLVIENGRKVIR